MKIIKNSFNFMNPAFSKQFFNNSFSNKNSIKFINKIFFKQFSEYNFDMKKDYYKILGIEKSATEKEIKLAYLKLVKKYHPDATQGKTTEMFKEITQAYEILSDSNKKSIYDNQGSSYGSSFFSNQYNNNTQNQSWNQNPNQNNNANQYANYRYDAGPKMNDFYNNFKNNKFYQEFYETYTFKDQDGKYKTYTFKSNGNTNTYKKPEDGNPFYQDFNNILRNKRREREKKQGKQTTEEDDYQTNSNKNSQFYNDFNKFNSFQNQNYKKEYDYNYNYNYDYKYTLFYEILRFSAIFLCATVIVRLFSRLFYNVSRTPNNYDPNGLYSPSMIGQTRYEPIYHNDYNHMNNFSNRQPNNYYDSSSVRYK